MKTSLKGLIAWNAAIAGALVLLGSACGGTVVVGDTTQTDAGVQQRSSDSGPQGDSGCTALRQENRCPNDEDPSRSSLSCPDGYTPLNTFSLVCQVGDYCGRTVCQETCASTVTESICYVGKTTCPSGWTAAATKQPCGPDNVPSVDCVHEVCAGPNGAECLRPGCAEFCTATHYKFADTANGNACPSGYVLAPKLLNSCGGGTKPVCILTTKACGDKTCNAYTQYCEQSGGGTTATPTYTCKDQSTVTNCSSQSFTCACAQTTGAPCSADSDGFVTLVSLVP